MPKPTLSVRQEDAIFKSMKFKLVSPGRSVLQGPSWASIGRKYGVSAATVQGAWRRANLRNR